MAGFFHIEVDWTSRGGGTPLNMAVREAFEVRLGKSLRLNSHKPRQAKNLGERASGQGEDLIPHVGIKPQAREEATGCKDELQRSHTHESFIMGSHQVQRERGTASQRKLLCERKGKIE